MLKLRVEVALAYLILELPPRRCPRLRRLRYQTCIEPRPILYFLITNVTTSLKDEIQPQLTYSQSHHDRSTQILSALQDSAADRKGKCGCYNQWQRG